MKVKVNGKVVRTDSQNAAALLKELEVRVPGTAVMLNGDILDSSKLDSCDIKDGDSVEIVRFMRGG